MAARVLGGGYNTSKSSSFRLIVRALKIVLISSCSCAIFQVMMTMKRRRMKMKKVYIVRDVGMTWMTVAVKKY